MERSLSLNARGEGLREQCSPTYVKFQLEDILLLFNADVNDIQNMFQYVDENETIESQQVFLRSQIVLLASAFDFYMHNITKYALERIFKKDWDRTERYKNLKIELSVIESVLDGNSDEEWFYKYISDSYSKDTLISFESFKDQMNLIGIDIKSIAKSAFYEQGCKIPAKDKLKFAINDFYAKRNLVSHQSSRLHENAQMHLFTKSDVENYIKNINKIINIVQELIKEKG